MADFRVQGFCQSQLTQIAAQKAKLAAEEYFKLGNLDMAIEQAFAALDFNPKLPLIQNYIAAYMVHKFASMQSLYKRKKRNDSEVLYSVLFIEDFSSVDEATIRKHFKETALLIHPDKNDSVAAEGAFKIVRQALETLLSDQNKRRKAGRR
ncbi:hypothetical protein DITRI_Ditri15bG0051200 [Diplodiscus trichospermus]